MLLSGAFVDPILSRREVQMSWSPRRLLASLLLILMPTIGGFASGCFGTFPLTRTVYEFNKDVSNNKFVQWLVFLGFVILPAYEAATLVDAIVLNSIEFWRENPPTTTEGDDESKARETVQLEDGRILEMTRVEGGVRARVMRGGRILRTYTFLERDQALVVRDGRGRRLGMARQVSDGVEVSVGARGDVMFHPAVMPGLVW